MVGGPSWRAAVPLARELESQGVELGLHLDFTECPLLPGSRHDLRELLVASLLRRLDAGMLRAEIRAQLDAYEQALGHAPTYVDGHQHVHQFAGIRTELLAELDRRGGAPRPWLRSTRRGRAGPGRATAAKAAFIERLGAPGMEALAGARGYRQNRHLLGVYDFQGGSARYRELLTAWLAGAEDGDLLMCHPALDPDEADPIGPARRAEFEVLAGPAFGPLLQAAGLTLASMETILATPPSRG
jgi:predicted glycoside hydrolase/deacetylase ChbG (UPF0249 family)